MTQGNPHCSILSLPLSIEGVKEAGERAGIRAGGPEPTPEQYRSVLFPAMGIDPFEWLRVQLFGLTAGSAAEARFSNLTFAAVWNSYGSSDDTEHALKCFRMIGLSEQEAFQLYSEQAENACVAMAQSDVWRAVVTLAEELPSAGRMSGRDVVAIVQRALNE
jgi:hypothetical protein